MSLLKLTYHLARDKFQTVTLLGSPDGIRNLYWQLTHNYKAQDGSAIGAIKITNLDGVDCTEKVLHLPNYSPTYMDNLGS